MVPKIYKNSMGELIIPMLILNFKNKHMRIFSFVELNKKKRSKKEKLRNMSMPKRLKS
jgi:hypothetical protein